MSRSWKGGSTRRWRNIRAAVLQANAEQNKGQCRLQVKGVCTGTANTAHHLKGKAYGDDIRYIVAACRECNLHVGDPTKVSPAPRPRSNWGIK